MSVYPNAIDSDQTKICSKCKKYKLFSEFGRCSKSKLKIKSACKSCLRLQNKEYAKQKRASMSEIDKKNHAKKCKYWREEKIKNNPKFYQEEYQKNIEKRRAAARKYYHNNINKCRARLKEYQNKNREKVRIISRNWKDKNPDKVQKYIENNRNLYRESSRKRRAKIKGSTIVYFSTADLMKRMSIFGYKCAYCKGNFDHIDHVIPISKGGYHCLANLRPACENCNCSKHAKKLSDWLGEVL